MGQRCKIDEKLIYLVLWYPAAEIFNTENKLNVDGAGVETERIIIFASNILIHVVVSKLLHQHGLQVNNNLGVSIAELQ